MGNGARNTPTRQEYWNPSSMQIRLGEVGPLRDPPKPIDVALREDCRIRGRQYFVIAVQDDNTPLIYSAPPQSGTVAFEKFVNIEGLMQEVSLHSQSASNPPYAGHDYGFDSEGRYSADTAKRRGQARRYEQSFRLNDLEDDERYPTRKRPRASAVRHATDNLIGLPPTPVNPKRPIVISNEEELRAFYDLRFKNCQQNACKLIAKAWVKAVEPKKQSTHPYTGADEKAPGWWPKPWGLNSTEKVRHKEPDHLLKYERVNLLNHILGLIIEPSDQQHPDIRNLRLNVSKLEEITMEALSTFFGDKDHPSNLAKRPFLKEIFKVAKTQERFKNKEIDKTTVIHVSSDDRLAQGYASDTEDTETLNDETDQDPMPISVSSSTSPQRALTLMSETHADQSPPTQLQDDNDSKYTHLTSGSGQASEQAGFMGGSGMTGQGLPQFNSPLPISEVHYGGPDSNRRAGSYASAEYTSPPTANVFSQHWPASGNSQVYPYQPQAGGSYHSFIGHNGLPLPHVPQNEPFNAAQFADGLVGEAHHGNHGYLPRNDPIDRSPLHPSPDYRYMHQGGDE
ncbi:Uu.00g003600.m01.CDS01 [Anthostomella pinea]|uniref:Uu.00g003600.m01.CDS01 n=1 Tax=Anthostomella pinea TaxID=933095 RepID=A0AAI8VJR9_9PEZI|nr:Uu.00g003600.m01.CDS01 [Anthostomella pinea]